MEIALVLRAPVVRGTDRARKLWRKRTGVPYIKAPPMGKVQLTGPSGENMGYVNFKTAPLPPAPPPTIVRFGDVGVAPAGCPMCPVLDEEAVKKQKEELKKNAHKIERLEKADAVRLWMASMGCAWLALSACQCAICTPRVWLPLWSSLHDSHFLGLFVLG